MADKYQFIWFIVCLTMASAQYSINIQNNTCLNPVPIPPCTETYRRIDGSCTNARLPFSGMTNLPYKRYLPPRYENGIDEVQKTGVTGLPLMNTRSISLQVCSDLKKIENGRTIINTAFGQFIDHDLVLTRASPFPCTLCDNTSPDCINIEIPPEDIANKDQQCMTLTRSAPVSADCGLLKREQLNLWTAALDLSQVYGNNEKAAINLRSLTGGLLKSVNKGINGRELLPPFGSTICRDETPDKPCFLTGDGPRTNINMHLAAVHTLFLREHNRLARKLQAAHPYWNDEKLYQEARRINIAQYQSIIYKDWLPLIIGWEVITKYAAAYRLHVLVRDVFQQIHPSHVPIFLTLQNTTFRAVNAYVASGIDGLLAGSLIDNAYEFDPSFADGLHNLLLDVSKLTKRFDLAAINIKRCRDHGCAPYIKFREMCGLGVAKTFSDLTNIDPKIQAKLESIYKDVANIELFVGGISETHIPSAAVGETFACMIALQFRDLKKADRFFFENPAPANPYPFTISQLNSLYNTSLSSLICENIDGITSIQPYAFLSPDIDKNGKVSCSQIPKLDLSLF